MTEAEITKAALEELEPDAQLKLAHTLMEAVAPAPDWHLPIVVDRLAKHRERPDQARSVSEVSAKVFPELS